MKAGFKTIIGIKVLIHLMSLVPLFWLTLSAINGHLGAEPVEEILHFTGKSALHALFACLLLSPIANWFRLSMLYRFRRLVGLYSFFWAFLHLITYAWLDLSWNLSLLIDEITSRNYLILGMFAWVVLLILSITSIDKVRSKLGSRWQKLHNWIYVIALLGPIHYYWSTKSEITEPSIYILFAIVLLAVRKQKIQRWLFR